MIHRAILGSIERFIGTLVEHYEGHFPIWLSPVQVGIIPITDQSQEYADKLKDDLQRLNLRVIIDKRNESLNKRIREATLKKIPYLLIIGEKEVQSSQVAVRKRQAGDLGSMAWGKFIEMIQKEIEGKG